MTRLFSLAAIAALALGTLALTTPARAAPVLSVVAIDTHGNTSEYLKRLATTVKLAKAASPNSIWRVWEAQYSGVSTGTIYVTVEYESQAALAASDAASSAGKEFAASVAALKEMGRTIESRAILVDRTP